ncbi:MAG: hypothetical protein JSR77_10115 [Planctomycetes bacterium]|nr:hypothetical protein [Planctomycetota bacterium]
MAIPPAPGSSFRKRLAYYLFGLAIGLVMLGLFQMARQKEAQERANPQTTTAPPQK